MRTNFDRPLQRAAAAVTVLSLAAAALFAPNATDTPGERHSSTVMAAYPEHPKPPLDTARCEVEQTNSPFKTTTVWEPHRIDGNPWQTVAKANPGIKDPGKLHAMDMASLHRSGILVAEATRLSPNQNLEVPVVVGRHALRQVTCTPVEASMNHMMQAEAHAATGNTMQYGIYRADPEGGSGITMGGGTTESDTAWYSFWAELKMEGGIPDTTGIKSAGVVVDGIASDGDWSNLESITTDASDRTSNYTDATTRIALGGQAPIRPIDTATANGSDLALMRTAQTFVDNTVTYVTGH